MKHALCPICGEGKLLPRLEKNSLREGALAYVVDTQFSQCDSCEAEITLPEQLKFNQKNVIRAKGRALGMPEVGQLIAWRRRHGLSQEAAGKLTGLGKVAFCKYETLALVPSAPTVRLLKVLIECDEAVSILAQEWNVEIASRTATRQAWIDEAASLFFQGTTAVNDMSTVPYIPVGDRFRRSVGKAISSLKEMPNQWVTSVSFN